MAFQCGNSMCGQRITATSRHRHDMASDVSSVMKSQHPITLK